MTVPFDHLLHLSDEIGTFEHADHESPRFEHGYCVDDVARVLIAVCQADNQRHPQLSVLEARSLRFLVAATGADGTVCNRRDQAGTWSGDFGTGDWWGRALWAFGVCSQRGATSWARRSSFEAFELGAQQTSPSPRALAFATLGAAEILDQSPDHHDARRIMVEFVGWFDVAPRTKSWPWPEPRLAYANALICNALIAAGHHLDRLDIVREGLGLLSWLLELQTVEDHLSPVPVGGAGPGEPVGSFDQQPIEIARLADACARAFEATYDPTWLTELQRCADWFGGLNDLGTPMWNPITGGGFDGLTAHGPNLNQGAESTLAAMTTAQAAQRHHAVTRAPAG